VPVSEDELIWRGRRMSREKMMNELVRAIFEQMHHFVALLDDEGRVVEVNPYALHNTDTRAEEIIGAYAWDTKIWKLTEGDPEVLKDSVSQAVKGKIV
jgi:PAS domain S-box-containing protein